MAYYYIKMEKDIDYIAACARIFIEVKACPLVPHKLFITIII